MSTTEDRLQAEFVRSFPDAPEAGRIYVSMDFATAMHLCACGCGHQVVTPLGPDDWELRYRGDGITLRPSIGNWRMPCRSHYWVQDGQIEWVADSGHTPPDHTTRLPSTRWRTLWDRLLSRMRQ